MEKLLNLINPALDFIDSGKFFRQPFKWLYYILGIANIMLPISLIKLATQYGSYLSGSPMACLILLIILSIPIAFFAAMIWIKRGNALKNDATDGSRFIAIPIVSNLIQTFGEWLGYLIGVGGFVTVLMLLLFGVNELGYILPMESSIAMLIGYPIIGFLVIVFARFTSEWFLALASIANRTQSIDSKLKKLLHK